ncbi:hypothetical protein RUND412_009521 [Rhizina undulata]
MSKQAWLSTPKTTNTAELASTYGQQGVGTRIKWSINKQQGNELKKRAKIQENILELSTATTLTDEAGETLHLVSRLLDMGADASLVNKLTEETLKKQGRK